MILFYVDDDRDDVEIFLDAVKTVDAEIVCCTAQDGEDALTRLRNCRSLPDVIFLDINMPKLNGIEFLRELRQDPKYKLVPAIIYSTGLHDLSAAEQNSLGVVHVLPKLTNFKKLCLELQQLLLLFAGIESRIGK